MTSPLAVRAQTAAAMLDKNADDRPKSIGPTRRTAKATEAAIRRAITAWKNAGLPIGAVEVSPDGTIRITTPIDRSEEPPQRQTPKKWRG